MKVELSVIIPVYNLAHCLSRTIDCVLNQSYNDFELLLIDDGSSDGSGKICEEYATKDQRIKVVHQENGGVTDARRKGVGLSVGEWICFVDGDDLLPINALHELCKSRSDVDIVVGTMCFVSDSGTVIGKNSAEMTGVLEHISYLKALLEHKTSLSPWGKLFRRRLFDSSVFDIPRFIPKGEDFIMCVSLAIKAKYIRIIDKCVYHYVQYPGSCIHQFHNTWEYEKMFDRFLLKPIIDNHLEKECGASIVHTHIHYLKGVLDDPALNRLDPFFRQIRKEAANIRLTFKERLLLEFAAWPPVLRGSIYRILKRIYVLLR